MLKHQLWSALLIGSLTHTALAADVKKECVDASTEGQTSRDAGELLKARDKFLTCSRDACPSVVRSSCATWLSEVERQLPSIVIRAAGANSADITEGTATVDGVKYPLDGQPIPLDPGKHVVVVDTEQGVHLEKTLLLAAGEKSRLIELQVTPAAAPQGAGDTGPQPKAKSSSGGVPTGAWVLGGLGVVALGSFGYFALSAKGELNDLENSCSPGCSDEQTKPGRNKAVVADISLGVGVAALAGAVTWALLSGSSDEESQRAAAQLTLAPTQNGAYAGLSGRF